MKLTPLAPFNPPSLTRAWTSTPHPTLPLLATASSDKSVRVYSLTNHQLHSTLDGGHKRSVRSVAWKPHLQNGTISLVTGSFDSTAGIWRRQIDGQPRRRVTNGYEEYETDVAIDLDGNDGDDEEADPSDWEFSLVLEGHDSEIKCVAFSPSGQYLATCSRDKSVWIWEEIGEEGEDEWETIAVLQEHEGDVKTVAWCADNGDGEVLASASYDDTIRLWREDGEGEWGCVAVLKDHDGTVHGLDWEDTTPKKLPNGDVEEEDGPRKTARLISCSADCTVRVWERISEPAARADGNAIPSTMRPASQGEQWTVQATLPKAHDRAIYSVSWSKKTGRVVSTGSDSRIVVYEERPRADGSDGTEWHIIATLFAGVYELNAVCWCPRYDNGLNGQEESIVVTGDDGRVTAYALEE